MEDSPMSTDFCVTTEPMAEPAVGCTAELERLGDEIAELSAHLDAATARLLELIREFDARAGWNTGFRSCAEWLSWPVGLDRGAARERVRVARALAVLPRLAQALARGELSYAKVRALTRVATPGHRRAAARGGPGGDRRARRAHRPRLASSRSAGRGPRGDPTPHEPGAARVSGRRRHGRDPGTAGAGGGGGADPGADRGARSAVSKSARPKRSCGNVWRRRFSGASHDAAAAGGRAGPRRRNGASSRNRSRRPGRALPGRGPRRRSGAGGRGCARAVGPRRRRARSRRNVPAFGVRREPRGDATRSGWPDPRSRCPDANHSAGAAARAASSRSRMPLPGLWEIGRAHV